MKTLVVTIAAVFFLTVPAGGQEEMPPAEAVSGGTAVTAEGQTPAEPAAVPAALEEEPAPPAEEETLSDIPPDILVEEPEVQGFVYDPKGERDPFLRLVDEHGVIYNYDQRVVQTDLNLEGILAGGGENLAIINSDIVTVGDMVGAYTVEGISTDTVILRKGQDELSLTLNKEE